MQNHSCMRLSQKIATLVNEMDALESKVVQHNTNIHEICIPNIQNTYAIAWSSKRLIL